MTDDGTQIAAHIYFTCSLHVRNVTETEQSLRRQKHKRPCRNRASKVLKGSVDRLVGSDVRYNWQTE